MSASTAQSTDVSPETETEKPTKKPTVVAYPARYDRFDGAVRKYNAFNATDVRRAFQENLRALLHVECGLQFHTQFENVRVLFLLLASLTGFGLLLYSRYVSFPENVPNIKIGVAIFVVFSVIGTVYCGAYLEAGNFAAFFLAPEEDEETRTNKGAIKYGSGGIFGWFSSSRAAAADHDGIVVREGALSEFLFSDEAYPNAGAVHKGIVTQRVPKPKPPPPAAESVDEQQQQQQQQQEQEEEDTAVTSEEQKAEVDETEEMMDVEVEQEYQDAPHDVLIPRRSDYELEFFDQKQQQQQQQQRKNAKRSSSKVEKAQDECLKDLLKTEEGLGVRLFSNMSLGDDVFQLKAELVHFRGSVLPPVVLRACSVEMYIEEFFSTSGMFYPPALRVELRRLLKQLLIVKSKDD